MGFMEGCVHMDKTCIINILCHASVWQLGDEVGEKSVCIFLCNLSKADRKKVNISSVSQRKG